MSNNQNILEDLSLLNELDEQAGETITGGYEVFTVINRINSSVAYTVDNRSVLQKPGQALVITASKGGIITFDTDSRKGYIQLKSYDLANGKKYAFQADKSTSGNPYDLNLFTVG